MNQNAWMKHPALANMDPLKLELIRTAAAQTSGKSGKDLAPILLALITSAQKKRIRFSQKESSLILDLLKEGKTEKEQQQIDQTVQTAKQLLNRH